MHFFDFICSDQSPGGQIRWRFASHPRFPYWALNMKQRHQLLSQAKIYLHQHPRDANLTLEDLQAMVGEMSAEHLMKRMQRYASKVQGSNQYWFQRYLELRTLLEQRGSPTFFWTVSSADTYWPELHSLMPHPTDPTHSMRVQAVIQYPHLTDWYFTAKLKNWVETWLYKVLDAEWHWYRIEYQARGSTHAHGCAKLRNDPDICSLVQKAAIGWFASEQTGDVSQSTMSLIQEGEQAKKTVLEYVDWLVTTCNSSIPSETWHLPHPHPCTKQPNRINDSDSDYEDLVNSVQRHTRCSAAYCLKKKPGQQEAKCRFEYPRPEQESTMISFEKLNDGHVRATLTTRRNDPRINSHSRVMLQHWRANVDLQVIVDIHACARYLTKYAAKGEPRSKPVSAIFKSCVENLNSDSDSRRALRSAMLRAVGERDYSAQETAHMLLSLPLVSCTYTFVTLSLDGSCRLKEVKGAEEGMLEPSMLHYYAARKDLPDVNLCTFASTYTVYQSTLRKRSNPVIVRTFPTYSSEPRGEHYGRYCKYQLLKYKPWVEEPSNVWNGGDDTDNTCITAYHTFLQTDAAQLYVPHITQELELAQQHINDDDSTDEEESPAPPEDHDEWMLLCRINNRFQTNSDTDNYEHDWSAAAREFPADLLQECPSWIQSQRRESLDTPNSQWCRTLPPVDVNTLNDKQNAAYTAIVSHHTRLMSGQSIPPLHMIICGTAGTGKSYLITAISQALGSTCLLTGTTGMAGFNISGKTLHSALQLPVRNSNNRDLQGASLQRLQLAMTSKLYIIIDEMSMIGQRMLAWVDRRLRQATGKLDVPMGGMSIILFGDFGQLPPVGDRPLYASPGNHELAIHGHTIYMQCFNTVVILSQILRQSGDDPAAQVFRELLLRLRNGQVNRSDWKHLLQRSPQTADNRDTFEDAVHLYYNKDSVAKHNFDRLASYGTPIARLNAIHSNSTAAAASPDDAGGLQPVLFLAKNARIMLTSNLWQEVGLCNGAAGTVREILYQTEHKPPDMPIAVLVDMDSYAGPSMLAGSPSCIPIPPRTFEWESSGHRYSRQQIPLLLRNAITIHKSQGQTLDKAVINIGHAELAAGSTFVAISRLRRLEDALIEPMPFERLNKISCCRRLQERLQEEKRLHTMHLT